MNKNLFLLLILFVASTLFAADWPQWRGPNRDGISTEQNLLKSWPAEGPRVLWKVPIGEGYSGMAISGGRLYTMDAKGKDEFVVCVDAATGKEIWRIRSDESLINDQGNGPRSTPTVDSGRVFALGAQGMLLALNADTGKTIWWHNLRTEFGSEIPDWGTSTSPLVEGNSLLVDVGGKGGHSIMSFNKVNGAILWKNHSDMQGYSSPIAVTINGVRQILFFTGTSLVSISPSGKVFWQYPWKTSWHANIATPIFIAPDKVFLSTSYDTGAGMLQVKAANGRSTYSELWKNKVMQNHFNSSVLYQGYLYGFDNAILKAIDLKGNEKWKQSGFGKGSVVFVDGHLIVLGERGQLALVEANPIKYIEKSRVQIVRGKTWTSPSIANGNLYLRNQKEMLALQISDAGD